MAAVIAPRQFVPPGRARNSGAPSGRPAVEREGWGSEGAAAPALPLPQTGERPERRGRRRAAGISFPRAVLLAGIPVLCLILYVGMWTCAMRGGYYRNRLTTQIRALEVENNSLQAEVRALQSPARIFREATAMKMQRPTDIRFVEVPAGRR